MTARVRRRKPLRTYVVKGEHAKDFMNACNYIIANYPKGLRGAVRECLFKDPGVRKDDHNNIHIDTTKFQAGLSRGLSLDHPPVFLPQKFFTI